MSEGIGALAGGLLGAGGQIAGGILASQGGLTNGDIVNPVFDPNLNLAYQASLLNSLSGLGFGDINQVPDYVQQLMGRLQSASIDEKTKRRALTSLQNIQNRMGKGNDFETAYSKAVNTGRLEQALSRLGVSKEGLSNTFDQNAALQSQLETLRNNGMGALNTDTILSRYRAANDASRMIGDASNYAQTGEVGGVIGSLLNQDTRNLNRLDTKFGLMANFGGMSQAAAQKQITDAHLDQQLRVIQNALGLSSGIQAALNPATTAAMSGAAGSANAAQIAAQQAQAANSLRNQTSLDRAQSIGNAVSGAASSFGTGLGDYLNAQMFNRQNPLSQTQNGFGDGSLTPSINAAANGNVFGSYLGYGG